MSIGIGKIDDSTLKMYDIVIVEFLIQDKFGIILYFEKTFLLSNTSIEVVLEMFFLALSNADIEFKIKSFIEGLIT